MAGMDFAADPKPGADFAQHYEAQVDLGLRWVKYSCRLERVARSGVRAGLPELAINTAGDWPITTLWRAPGRAGSPPLHGWAGAWPAVLENPLVPPHINRAQTILRKGSKNPFAAQGTARPAGDRGLRPDQRYEPLDVTSAPRVGFPVGRPGLVISTSNDASQEDVFLPAAGELVAANENGDPRLSSQVADLTDSDEVDVDFLAPLHSVFRVARLPHFNSVALQYGQSGFDGISGHGLVAQRPGKPNNFKTPGGIKPPFAFAPKLVFGFMGSDRAGPIHAGGRVDKHRHFDTREQDPVNAAHISTNAYFRKDPVKDAPLDFQEPTYFDPGVQPWHSRAMLRFDPEVFHRFGTSARDGLWKLLSESFFTTDEPPPPDPPPRLPPPPPEQPPHTDPPPPSGDPRVDPPPPGGGFRLPPPGGGHGGLPPPGPPVASRPRPGGGIRVAGGGFTPIPVGAPVTAIPPQRRAVGQDVEGHPPYAAASTCISTVGLILRAAPWATGSVDYARSAILTPQEQREFFGLPYAASLVPYAANAEGRPNSWTYAQRALYGRPALAQGGFTLLPPDVTPAKALAGDVTSTAGLTAYMVVPPTSRIAYALPKTDGTAHTGISLEVDTGAGPKQGSLGWSGLSTTGAVTELVRLLNTTQILTYTTKLANMVIQLDSAGQSAFESFAIHKDGVGEGAGELIFNASPTGIIVGEFAATNPTIDFGNGNGGALKWDTANSRFDFSNGLKVNGKLTVTGLLDPTGLVLAEQAASPTTPTATEGVLWVKNSSPNRPWFTDDGANDLKILLSGEIPQEKRLNVSSATANVTAVFGDHIEGSTNAFTVTLPVITATDIGKIVSIANDPTNANSITVDGDGTDTINGSATLTLTPGITKQFLAISTSAWRSLP